MEEETKKEEKITYYINKKLKKTWDKIKDGGLAKIDDDRVYIVDGRERSGKSLFTIQQAAYIDPTILNDENGKVLPRICFTPEEFLTAIRTYKSTKEHTLVIIYDEAFRGLSSKSAISKVNKVVVSALMEMGQNNLVVFIVSPSFFMLELYAAVLRSHALFHVQKDINNPGNRWFRTWNYDKKGQLYQLGLKYGWQYKVHTAFRDRFFGKYPGGDDFERRYRKKKQDSLREQEKVATQEEDKPVGKRERQYILERQMRSYALYKEGKSFRQIADIMQGEGRKISKDTAADDVRAMEKLEKQAV